MLYRSTPNLRSLALLRRRLLYALLPVLQTLLRLSRAYPPLLFWCHSAYPKLTSACSPAPATTRARVRIDTTSAPCPAPDVLPCPRRAENSLQRCGSCQPCTRDDCGQCQNCADKPKFGGPGLRKQACEKKVRATPSRERGYMWERGHADREGHTLAVGRPNPRFAAPPPLSVA